MVAITRLKPMQVWVKALNIQAFLVEYLRYQSDGFKKDEPNERTGFHRNDLIVKFSAQTNKEQGLQPFVRVKVWLC